MQTLPDFELNVPEFQRRTAHLTPGEFGAAMLLIGFRWSRGELPVDDEARRKIARCPKAQWPKVRAVIAPFIDDAAIVEFTRRPQVAGV